MKIKLERLTIPKGKMEKPEPSNTAGEKENCKITLETDGFIKKVKPYSRMRNTAISFNIYPRKMKAYVCQR